MKDPLQRGAAQLQKLWWSRLESRAKAEGFPVPCDAYARRDNYLPWPSGIGGVRYAYVVLEKQCGIEMCIERSDRDENRSILNQLKQNQFDVEEGVGELLFWEGYKRGHGCKIRADRCGGYRSDEHTWPALQAWQILTMRQLQEILNPYLRQFM
jgi:Domain of unknown function (DUF4268)